MGVDFIQRTSRTFEKHLDLQRVKLGTADLFTRELVETCPTFAAELECEIVPNVGDELIAEFNGGVITLCNERRIIARGFEVSPAIIEAIQDSCGLASAVVQEIHEFSRVIEVTLC